MTEQLALILKAAGEYRRLGWWPVPLSGKQPRGEGWPQLRLSEDELAGAFREGDNLGLILGEASGGLVDVDLDHPLAVRLAPFLLPPTPMRHGRAGAGVSHYWYQCELKQTQRWQLPPDEAGQRVTVIEARSNGGQTMVPPSIHPSGEPVQWIKGGKLTPAKVAARELASACQAIAALAALSRLWLPGARNDLAMRLGGWWAKAGLPRERAELLITALCGASGDNEAENRLGAVRLSYDKHARGETVAGALELASQLGEGVFNQAARWLGLAGRTAAKTGRGTGDAGPVKGRTGVNPYRYELSLLLELTDEGNARRFLALYGERVLHCALLGGWYWWDGQRWQLDSTGRALEYARECSRRCADDAINLDADVRVLVADGRGGKRLQVVPAEDARAVSSHWAAATQNAQRLSAMLALAAADRRVAAVPEELDSDPRLLNCANGTLALHSERLLAGGEPLEPHQQAHRLTKLAPVEWQPEGECPRWQQFLGEIFGDAELESFMQRLAGYSLFGGNPEQVIAFLWGSGANGKSTFLETLSAMLGDYALTTPSETVLAREGGSNNQVYALAQIKGGRLLTIAETDEGQRLAEAMVKAMTGGERITARYPHGMFFSYTPEFLPVVATNHMPELRNVDEAIRRRVLLVPFKVTIPREERDPRLKEQLRAELPGILRWAVAGLLDYEERLSEGKSGLAPPASVLAATASYFEDQDPLAPYLAERCILSETVRCLKGVLYKDYKDWAETNGRWALGVNKFGGQLKRALMAHYNLPPEAVENHGGTQRWWLGIALRDAPAAGGGLLQ